MVETKCDYCEVDLFDRDVVVWDKGKIKKFLKIRCPRCFKVTIREKE